MAVVRRRGKKWQLDYRLNGKRKRLDLESKDEAYRLCDQYNALKKAQRLEEFHNLLDAHRALETAKVTLSGKKLKDAVLEYLRTCSALKSNQTYKNEMGDFKRLYDFLHKERDVYYLREVTPQLLEEYQGRLMKTASASTCNRRFTSFKHFFNKCVEWGYLEKSPAAKIRRRREKENPRKTWNDDEIARIISALPDWSKRAFRFMAETGARPVEIRNAQFGDWDHKEKTFVVYSDKNSGVSRTLFLADHTQRLIEEIFEERRFKNARPNDYVFLNAKGGRLNVNSFTRAIGRVRRKLGIPEGKVPYGLRHTYATKLSVQDVSTEKIKRLMGHKSIRTTERYNKLQDRDLRNTVDQTAKVFDFVSGKEVESVTKSHKGA